jgi:hypothetical protein
MARRYYLAARNNPTVEAAYRAELEAMLLAPTEGDAAFELTSSTVNGQTFSGTRTKSQEDRFVLLQEIVACFNRGGVLPRTTRIAFGP